MPSPLFMTVYRIICALTIFVGAALPMSICWNLADITMGLMTLINLPCCVVLGGVAFKALRDYELQKKNRLNPTFKYSIPVYNAEGTLKNDIGSFFQY